MNEWLQYITAATALTGAILGIMNTWRAMDQNRLRLKVRPTHALLMPQAEHLFAIEVINRSTFPVAVSEIGFTEASSKRRFSVVEYHATTHAKLPLTLEPRDAISFYFDPGDRKLLGQVIGKAYAKTTCGEIAFGSTPALKQLRYILSQAT